MRIWQTKHGAIERLVFENINAMVCRLSHCSHDPPGRHLAIEICNAIAGPLTTRVFANLGAEVIKIESEGKPDLQRMIGFGSTTNVERMTPVTVLP